MVTCDKVRTKLVSISSEETNEIQTRTKCGKIETARTNSAKEQL